MPHRGEADCSLETDRAFIERHVSSLFDEAYEAPVRVAFGAEDEDEVLEAALLTREVLEPIRGITSYPARGEILEQFNAFVKGPLKESVVERLGEEVDISFKLCIAGWLPFVFFAPIYACEGLNCNEYAALLGTSSPTPMMVTNCLLNSFAVPAMIACWLPLLLRAAVHVAEIPDECLQLPVMIFAGLLVTCLTSVYISAVQAMGYVVVLQYSPVWLCGLLASLTLLCG